MRETASALIVGEGLGVNVGANVGVSSVGWRTLDVHPIKPIRRRSVALTPSRTHLAPSGGHVALSPSSSLSQFLSPVPSMWS